MSYRTLRRLLRIAAAGLAAVPVGLAATTQATDIAPTAVLIGPVCATADPTAFPCPAIPVAPLLEQATALAEDDPGWDCRTNGNGVCGYGYDPAYPGSWTVDGLPYNEAAARCVAAERSGLPHEDCGALYEDTGERSGLLVTVRCADGHAFTEDYTQAMAWFVFTPDARDRGCAIG